MKFAGVVIDTGDSILIVPPLSICQFQAVKEKLALINDQSAPSADRITAKFDLVFQAVRCNYPDMTEEELLQRLDLSGVLSAFAAALGAPAERTKGE